MINCIKHLTQIEYDKQEERDIKTRIHKGLKSLKKNIKSKKHSDNLRGV